MAQTKGEILSFLSDAGIRGPKHRFGQNFMIDGNLVRLVADAGEILAGDVVVEVGPGTGTLTEELLKRVEADGMVVGVEIDRQLAEALRRRFDTNRGFVLIDGDALAGKHRLSKPLEAIISSRPRTKLVANLPYNIASPLVVECLLAGVELLAFTVQREVAERLEAHAGEEAYGPLSVVVQLLAEVEVMRTLPPSAFWPMPKVDSALVRLRRRADVEADFRDLGHFIHQLFSARRKTLRRSMKQAGYDAETILAELNFAGEVRPEEVTPEQFLMLWRSSRARGSKLR